MRILWSSDVAEQIIRRMNDAELGMGDCLRDAASAARALDEANEDGESKTLNRLAARLAELTQQLEAAQQRLDDLVGQTRSTNERFEEAERRISAMFDGAGRGEGAASKPREGRGMPSFEVRVLPELRPLIGIVTPEWLRALANDPHNFLN